MNRPMHLVLLLTLALEGSIHAFTSLQPASTSRRPAFVARSSFYTLTAPKATATGIMPEPPKLNPQDSLSEATSSPSSSSSAYGEMMQSQSRRSAPQKSPKKAADDNHKSGVFAPLVLLAKDVLGDEQLNKIRAKAISLHSDVIANFVETADSPVGNAILKTLFAAADKNHNGTIEEAELADALHALGFNWLQDKQVHGIFERADANADGAIGLEEWIAEAPKTLRTNLIKLAKKNGGELGFLV